MFDIADLAQQEGLVTREEFLAAAADPAPIRDLAPTAPNLEGFLFPATYEFPRHVTASEMVQTMVKKFREEWDLSLIHIWPPAVASVSLYEN